MFNSPTVVKVRALGLCLPGAAAACYGLSSGSQTVGVDLGVGADEYFEHAALDPSGSKRLAIISRCRSDNPVLRRQTVGC